jgi:hypothetical protein
MKALPRNQTRHLGLTEKMISERGHKAKQSNQEEEKQKHDRSGRIEGMCCWLGWTVDPRAHTRLRVGPRERHVPILVLRLSPGHLSV